MSNRCPNCQTENPPDSKFCKECAAPLTGEEAQGPGGPTRTMERPREELTTGSTFAGRYQIIEELGRGGMGRVYKVFDTEIQDKVALKLISPEMAADETTITRFRSELKLARDISHKHVCRMYDLNREGGTYYLTMEYIAGEDLKNMIRMSKQLTVGTAVCIARQICAGLTEAHAKGIVHRDLKPNNIMIDRAGNARIMDFGIARTSGSKGITGRGTMIGTPEYMSPEQVEGRDVDHRSDLYSLGIILYETLTGRLPFEGDTAFSVGVKQKSEKPEDPVKHNPRIPKDLSTLILKCLEKSPEDRCQSAGEVDAELERIEEGLPTTEKPIPLRKPSTAKSITVQFTPKRLLIPALIVAAVVVAAFLLLKPRSGGGPVPVPSDKPSLAVVYFENNSGKPELDHWRSGLCELLITDLSQSRFLHVLSGDRIYTMLEDMDLLETGKYSTSDLRNIASRGGASHILRGNYITAGNKFIINISLLNAETGTVLSSLREESLGEENITASVDRITQAVKAALDLSPQQISSDIDKDVGVVTTRSPEAYKHFVEGKRYDIQGNYPMVIESMKKAVAVDPEFAAAYHAMSWAYGNQRLYKEQDDCLKKALELSERLSDRERYLIQGDYYLSVERDNVKAEEAFRKAAELYPEDISAQNFLGIVNIRLGDRDKAIHHYSRAIELGTEDVVIYTNLAGSYGAMGLYDKQREVLESYIQKVGDNARIRHYLSQSYRYQGRYDEALSELEKARALAPGHLDNTRSFAVLHLFAGELDKAEVFIRQLLESEDTLAQGWGLWYSYGLCRLQGRFMGLQELIRRSLQQADATGQSDWKRGWLEVQAYYEDRQGRPELALKLFDEVKRLAVEAGSLAGEISALFGRGWVFIGQKNLDAARAAAEEIKQKIEISDPSSTGSRESTHMRWYYILQGGVAREEKQYARALENFEKGQALLSYNNGGHMRFLDELGHTSYLAGDLERAQREYSRLTQLHVGKMDFGDLYVKAFFWLGKIHQEQGNRAEAIKNFEKFLDLWKDADPGIPEVEEAKEALAALKRMLPQI